MKRLVLFLFLIACGNAEKNETPILEDIIEIMETHLDLFETIPELELAIDTVKQEQYGDASPQTCTSVLSKGQCISNENCYDFEACLGVGGCEEPPCWGLCKDFPGQCLPNILIKTCEKDGDCPNGYICRKNKALGYCKAIPIGFKACYSDDNCPSGQYCAGEIICKSGALCAGVEYFGKCVKKPDKPKCFEDDDCPNGQSCIGQRLCPFNSNDCEDLEGQCATPQYLCMEDKDCEGTQSYCTLAFECKGQDCPFPSQFGECKTPPGYGGCWEDSDCGTKFVCRASLACPSSTYCGQNVSHPGQCGSPPFSGEGITLNIVDKNIKAGQQFHILAVNNGSTPIFIHPCFPYIVKKGDGKGGWYEVFIQPEECIGPDNNRVIIPVGSGIFLPVKITSGGLYKVHLPYLVGCKQNGLNTPCKDTPTSLEASSGEFVVE